MAPTNRLNLDARQLQAFQIMLFSTDLLSAQVAGSELAGIMTGKNENTLLGKLVFTLTAIAMLYFFWWLLLYDHGVVSIHH
ncbi:hypothetical protein [Profundibacter sp.]